MTDKQLIGEVSENVILATRAWIAADYENYNLLIKLRKSIQKYNKAMGIQVDHRFVKNKRFGLSQ